MDQKKLSNAQDAITGRSHHATASASVEQEAAGAIVVILAAVADEVEVLAERDDIAERISAPAAELANQLRSAVTMAQMLNVATQGDPREVQTRNRT